MTQEMEMEWIVWYYEPWEQSPNPDLELSVKYWQEKREEEEKKEKQRIEEEEREKQNEEWWRWYKSRHWYDY